MKRSASVNLLAADLGEQLRTLSTARRRVAALPDLSELYDSRNASAENSAGVTFIYFIPLWASQQGVLYRTDTDELQQVLR